MSKCALITGITGQDGAYLSQLLISKGYRVYGTVRHLATANIWRLRELEILDKTNLIEIDLLNYDSIYDAIKTTNPDEIYNLASPSFVGTSFEHPIYAGNAGGLAVTRLLAAILAADPDIRFYQASTSEMFGKAQTTPQTETTPFYPRNPYGVAKLYGHWMTVNYRDSHNLFACSGILFNHESPLRGRDFVTRKISLGLSCIKEGQQDILRLGNLEAQRDWGFAGDYVEGMWRMLQHEIPSDYILATGKPRSVRDVVDLAAGALGMDLLWEGTGAEMVGIERSSGRKIVVVDPAFFRPIEKELLTGVAEKAHSVLGWRQRMGFEDLIAQMTERDHDRVIKKDLFY
ncbi:GDP-mannose 4,6 dehydratase [Rhodospirillum rubrum]|uniref:GDP-mannose 4,6-dehydratase n=1 Tax=Rhodospirillum rubrum (strain ATCC 11170 / ATH 1.1.1 / DSM 467 / LMG 4362 / NCIMB 8255 / S1) TaxID=269796 RepID=Q2RMK2_RHORT|nr:GDP-mannose 4,6-dehydratase [Rhodospirillum rubrum]ABC24643.1 NAD-dependent epimerase/dehydratase [Rhodospirillum rubrum ATCC 11170]MBK1664096.1 GDP-mannose 4,6 dehydratase [Rhodospirillum rubrum]MBK1676069.1 GDP-mannose 4,6 dehydratase [Rhodospirillum rubrum]QXG82479.1 GDP-mannose 4,6-dehydratase [Rhodospirillum rubrum]